MAKYSSEEDYIEESKPVGKYSTDEDYEMPKNDPRLNTVRGMGRGQQFVDSAAYQQRRMTNAMKQAWYSLTGRWSPPNKQQAEDLAKLMKHEDKVYKDYLRSPYNPHRTAAAAGNIVGAITHPVSMATMPIGGGGGIWGRALVQGGLGAATEFLTNPNDERSASILLGLVGGGVGSLGTDTLAKGYSGFRGNWTDPVAQKADELSKRFGLKPGIAELNEYSGRQVSPADYRKKGTNFGLNLEKHAKHNLEANSRAMKEAMGVTNKPTSDVYPKTDALHLNDELRKEADAIWQPFEKAVRGKTNGNVYPLELWNGLQELNKHYSKVLKDNSVITDDVVRNQLNSILYTTDKAGNKVLRKSSAKLPQFTAKEYKEIISSLTEAQHRIATLSKGEAPAYSDKVGKAVTDVYGKAKNDMATWGKRPGNESTYSAWDTALKDYQDKIIAVKHNPVFESASNLDKRGYDVHKFIGDASEPTNYKAVRELLDQYNQRGMSNAAERLDLIDANSLSGMHGASGALAAEGTIPKMPSSSGGMKLLGDSYNWLTNRPSAKGMYFGDPLIPNLDNMGVMKGALSSVARRSPIVASRELGLEEGTALYALLQMMPFVGDEKDVNSQDPQYSHGIGPASQAGTRP